MQIIHKKLHSLNLLIVEDDESTLKWLSRVLSIYFNEVSIAKDAINAFEVFKEKSFDIVISDIEMPQVDGLHLLQKIALLSPKTMRIVMTAFNTSEYINRAIESDVHFYFKKPIDIDELLVAISTFTSKNILKDKVVFLGNNYLYYSDKKIIKNDERSISLTKKEVSLLEFLLYKNGNIVSIEEIENNVWKEPVRADAIRMVVTNLRKKIYSTLIKNIKGIGYKVDID
ncbi:response regulator transcription factor [Aliarcobacter vitoriensis]|uniref:response regulator transcription factor n=1 Tax=Aliarcobacter vitoriensis TaxID=2011099 RepID=UPI003AAD880F